MKYILPLRLSSAKGPFSVEWIPVDMADWDRKDVVTGGKTVEIISHYNGDAFAVLRKL